MTLREFILRYPSDSLSPVEKEALHHKRLDEELERLDLERKERGMRVSIGDETDVIVPDTAPTSTESEDDAS